ncbi:MAG: hypothetical protein Kow0063_16810 [Anaerolineae bacterium]
MIRLPDNWLVEDGSYLDLKFSYLFTQFGATESGDTALSFFGDVSIYFDDTLLRTYSINEPVLQNIGLRIDLPSELFNERTRSYHQIKVDLDAALLCTLAHKAQLMVHPESTLSLNYTLLPPALDLANFPRPFYQRSLEPDQVRFVLPAHPSETEVRGAAIIAGSLGSLTDNRMVISATTDVDWLKIVRAEEAVSEHLFVVGQPDRNQLVMWLNDNAALPAPVYRRQMALSSQGPSSIAAGDSWQYTITVTNTTSSPARSLLLTDRMPYQASLVDCRPACTEVGRNEVSWSIESLSPGEPASFSLTLRLTDTVGLPSQPLVLENSAILANKDAGPLNISSLTTAVETTPAEQELVISSGQADYFFVYDGQPVPETDGIIQEVISPWDAQKVILLITGVTEEAVYKASQALGLGTSFPGMSGPVAVVRQVLPSSLAISSPAVDLTLADLGYTDETIYGTYRQELIYWFRVPIGWQLNDDAYFRLFFTHSEAISEHSSTMTVLLNDFPMATIVLDEANAGNGTVQISLPNSRIRRTGSNKLSIQVAMQTSKEECETIDAGQAWVSILQDSLFHLDHRVQDVNVVDLDYFPYPFSAQSDLEDVLFVLPLVPEPSDLEVALRLVAALGDAVNADRLNLSISLGNGLDDETLSRYHIIAIGRPTANQLIQQVNSLLPQPFIPGTDEFEQQVGEVLLRLPFDIPVGYIQELPSPWNDDRVLLVVTGTLDEGVAWAAEALSRQSWRLDGNLALIRQQGEEIYTIDTRRLTSHGMVSAVTTAVPELTPVATSTPTSQAVAANENTRTTPTLPAATAMPMGGLPTWVKSFVGVTAVIVVAIFGAVIWRGGRRRGQ